MISFYTSGVVECSDKEQGNLRIRDQNIDNCYHIVSKFNWWLV